MGKAKTLLREHDEAIERMVTHLMDAYEVYQDSPISTCEFVGNLEAVKAVALSQSETAKVSLVDVLEGLLTDKED